MSTADLVGAAAKAGAGALGGTFTPFVLWAGAGLVAIAGVQTWRLHSLEAEMAQAEAARATQIAQRVQDKARADAANRVIEFNRLETTNEAISQARLDGAADARAASGSRGAVAGLRDDLARDAAAAAADVSRQSLAACRRDVAARDEVLGAMGDAGAAMAEAADGHATDSLMYQRAWPAR